MSKLALTGEVESPRELSFEDLQGLSPPSQIENSQTLGAKRPGQAVRLGDVLALAKPLPTAAYLGLHAAADDFHASVPLQPLLDRAILIYARDGEPLPAAAGGPYRLFIPDHTECHVSEIDECANVKFIDHMELTAEKGFDNRPEDDEAHQALHENE